MARETVLLMNPDGRIVWANRAAHELVRLPPGGLLGRNYLEFCPPETHRELLDLHRRKLAGETVRFRIDLGRPLEITSGPVSMGRRHYLFVVGRALDEASGDPAALAILGTGEMLGSKAARLDLNAGVLGALRDEAALLKGRVNLDPGEVPALRGSTWPLRAVLRALLRGMSASPGRVSISTGADTRRVWVKVTPGRRIALPKALKEGCRKALRSQRGVVRAGSRGVTVSFPRSSPSGGRGGILS